MPHPIPVWTDIYGEKELWNIEHLALSKVTPSARTSYSMCAVHIRLLTEMDSGKSLLLEIRSGGSFSVAALPKRFSTSPECPSGGSGSYFGRNTR